MRLAVVLVTAAFALLSAAVPVAADGTLALVKDIYPGDSSDPDHLVAVGNLVYFVADDGVHGRELWRTDGTEAGTAMVVDALPGSNSSGPVPLAAVGDVLYFNAKDGVHGRELWRTTGAGTGAKIVKNITPGSGGSEIDYGIALGNKLLFDANGSLFVTDGTSGGTHSVGPAGFEFVSMAGHVYYLSGGSNLDFRVWRSDGTATGTKQVGWSPVGVNYLAPTGNRLFMLVNSDELQSGPAQLWVSDGTAAGTVQLTADGALTKASSLRVAGSRAFLLDQEVSGTVLWRSNGTPAGTKILATLPGDPSGMYSKAGNVYLPVNIGGSSWQLWASAGTINGTRSIGSFTASFGPEEWATLGSTVYFSAQDNDADTWTLFQTGGTTATTYSAISSGPADGYPFRLTAAGDKLIFSADDGVTEREIWRYQP
jgi:ELWxxDGT repeat protein